MRAPVHSHTARAHQQPAWMQVGITVVGGVALGLLILQVLASRDHGFITRPDQMFQTPVVAVHQPAMR